MIYALTGEQIFRERVEYCMDELEESQKQKQGRGFLRRGSICRHVL